MSGAQENGGSLGSLGSAVLVQWFCVQPALLPVRLQSDAFWLNNVQGL